MGNYYETFDPPYFPDLLRKYQPIPVNNDSYSRPDSAIMDDMNSRMAQLHGLNCAKVRITSENEILRLRGAVDSPEVRAFLGRVAENIAGVRAVINELATDLS